MCVASFVKERRKAVDPTARVPVFSGLVSAMLFQLRMRDDFKSHPELATATRWDSPQGMASQMHNMA